MKDQVNIILKKISVLNQATLDSMLEESYISIIKNFTEVSIEILEADFAFTWWKFHDNDTYQIVYKSLNFPSNLNLPQKYENSKISKMFSSNNLDVKSHINIPVHYGDHAFGNIILCYKDRTDFSEEKLALTNIIGNIAAQAVTIPWLVENEEKALSLAEKQKEFEVLLAEEKLKTEFTANATHELRTPLAIMKGNVDLALMEKGNLKSGEDTLKAVSIEINILSEILKDLTLLTSPKQGMKNRINFTTVNILKLLNKVAKRVRVMAAKKNINIEIRTEENPNIFVSGDERYLEKLFLNLIKNSITYGKQDGSIIIRASVDKKSVKIRISDNGIGIPKEDLPNIFERFYRADKAHSSSGNHSGLGLAIVKWVAEMHGGNVDVRSTPGKGSTFAVNLPILKKK